MKFVDIEPQMGQEMHKWATDLFPINRSLTGPGVLKTLSYLQSISPDLTISHFKSGDKVFDWTVPEVWTISEAYIEDESGDRVVDFLDSNLHIVGYSIPMDQWMSLDELNYHLHSLESQPEAIPYVTSYYNRTWGFCISHNRRLTLKNQRYHVVIKSELKPGNMHYGEIYFPGDTEEEVFISTYICHPSMANNELSGPVVTVALANWIKNLPKKKYSYRIILIPETIGSISYLSRHHEILKRRVIAGFNITCVGDDRCYSFLPSRKLDSLSNKVALHVLRHHTKDFKHYSYLDRGSDERQYCSPGIDLPVASIMRSKYNEYPEYHTSLDDLKLITPSGLYGSLNAYAKAIFSIENNCIPKALVFCEPFLSQRGLYPSLSIKNIYGNTTAMMDLLAYSDGKISLLEIAEIINIPLWDLAPIVDLLEDKKLIKIM